VYRVINPVSEKATLNRGGQYLIVTAYRRRDRDNIITIYLENVQLELFERNSRKKWDIAGTATDQQKSVRLQLQNLVQYT
jgi:hypothetical protein